MNGQIILEYQWPYLLSLLPPEKELEATAKATGALSRKRAVDSASSLIRLALAYGFCGLSLRQTAAWAQVAGVAEMSDVALLNRLRKASDWLGLLLGLKLAEKAPPPMSSAKPRLRLVDATTVSRPGSQGADWRVHLRFDLARMAISHVELTDFRGGETLLRFPFEPGEVVVGDRGYAHRRGFWAVHQENADFIVRLNWQTVPLQLPGGGSFDLLDALRSLPEATAGEWRVQTAALSRDGIPSIPARLVAVRKSEAAAEAARETVLRERSRKSRNVDARTLESASYTFLLTTLPREDFSAETILETYRFRWQIELAFKRLKSLMHLDELPARDPPLARTYLYAKLLAALLLEEFTEVFLSFSPWGFRLARTPPIALAYPEGAA